jgi:CRP-like cAMP-binding protein
MRLNDRVILLKKVALFSKLDNQTLMHLAEIVEDCYVRTHDFVFRQGEVADALYVIIDGLAAVVLDGKEIKQITAGEVFGEIALLGNFGRTAGVRANKELLLLRITKVAFEDLLERHAALRIGVVRHLARTLNQANKREAQLIQQHARSETPD